MNETLTITYPDKTIEVNRTALKKDSLAAISRQYDVRPDSIKKINPHIRNYNFIVPGQKIYVPKG